MPHCVIKKQLSLPFRSFLASKLGMGDCAFFLAVAGVLDCDLDWTFCKGRANPLVIFDPALHKSCISSSFTGSLFAV